MIKSHNLPNKAMREVPRQQRLRQWVEAQLSATTSAFEPASQDASFRRYFRVRVDDQSFIVMDAPPEHEDCRPFVRVAVLMADAGVHVPRVIAHDYEHGFLLLSDLGTTSYLQALTQDNADDLFRAAVNTLVQPASVIVSHVNEGATAGGKVRAGTRTAARSVLLEISCA